MAEKFSIMYTPQGRRLHISGTLPANFIGEKTDDGTICALNEHNAAAIRRELPWCAPERVRLRKSIGCGDRLGIATAGHLRAVREGNMFPVLAQQSMREMQRARRSPKKVLDDATWGILEANYQMGFGCDADHLKTIEDIDACADAGFIGYTLDPGQYVDDAANTAGFDTLREKVNALNWATLRSNPQAHNDYFVAQHNFAEIDYLRSAAKYGAALAHVAVLNAHLAQKLGKNSYDLEVSVDETATVTTPAEHRFIALELKRLDINFIGLAPRFVGDFEKGVDYIGDLAAFEADYIQHVAIANEFDYKLSIHSGSDKFSIYPIIAKHSGSKVHVKTAGTSWVEALRVIAEKDGALFRQILVLACAGYDQNRASYHVSGNVDNIPHVADANLPSLLDHFDTREVLHVSFGQVLAQFYDAIYAVLNTHIESYHTVLHRHFKRHIQPFKA